MTDQEITGEARPHGKQGFAFAYWWERLGILVILLALVALMAVIAPNFASVDNLLNIARAISINAILAAGMTFVILTAGIDLSVGSTVAVSGVVAVLVAMAGVPAPLAIVAGVLAGVVAGRPQEPDAFVRLDTGYFDLEMCTGTAMGTGSSKWGLRHFRSVAEGTDLLPSGDNAIGGFYGPFFTPENGLINPPEHTVVDIEVVERGPVMHHYRMHGVVPDGLLAELRGKRFAIDWVFTHGTPYFTRTYHVDDFQTVVNGRSITNKITVGDEFEGGQGELVFDRFEAYGGTRYRAGDPYAEELVTMVGETVTAPRAAVHPKFEEFRRLLTGDLESAHWDLYWRLFCAWEKALDEDEIRERLARVRAVSHVRADLPERSWTLGDEPVDVSAVPDETIFPGAASKTVEFHSELSRAMIWWTSAPSGAFQIVQRRQSGWVNWGTNGENECPELPVGVEIKTAYGMFKDSWRDVADQLETPPTVTARPSSAARVPDDTP